MKQLLSWTERDLARRLPPRKKIFRVRCSGRVKWSGSRQAVASPPARICCSADGITANAGDNFNHHWQRTNLGQFLYAPAFACDSGGTDLYVAAMFGDFNPYTAHSNKVDTTGQVWGNAVPVGPNPEFFL